MENKEQAPLSDREYRTMITLGRRWAQQTATAAEEARWRALSARMQAAGREA